MEHRSPNRMLIVGNGSLFDEGLERLLSGRPGLEISRTTYTDDTAFLYEFLRQLPEVVILFEGSPLTVSRLFELVKDVPIPNLQVVTVLAQTSTIEMYAKRQVTAVGGDDFLALVRSMDD